ncbi:hypothetical protein ACFO0N_19095 [Halobium salinum]|uniref:Uncharacterized protein n=1 Tax=Halobium salinum TaxID=1364940 RepID=A0ABD5PGZ7_9EURY|nr:hypothetical protein [Halobium salinum]
MNERTGLVDGERADRFESACRTVVGDTLRSITYFTPDGFEQTYLRSDLDADADLAGFVEHESLGFRARTAYRDSELGDYEHTVRSFENGYITRVVGHEEGVFVTTDGLTMRRSEEVATALGELLD